MSVRLCRDVTFSLQTLLLKKKRDQTEVSLLPQHLGVVEYLRHELHLLHLRVEIPLIPQSTWRISQLWSCNTRGASIYDEEIISVERVSPCKRCTSTQTILRLRKESRPNPQNLGPKRCCHTSSWCLGRVSYRETKMTAQPCSLSHIQNNFMTIRILTKGKGNVHFE
jgi:hypothetical protein